MKRNIPDPNNHLISFFIDRQKKESSFEEKYEALMINTEKSLEKKLIDLFSNLGIHASTKTDRYSLPYNNQIKITQYGESYVNAAYNSDKLFRQSVRKILDENIYNLRFYIFIEVVDLEPMKIVNSEDSESYFNIRREAVNLYFNYHIKQ
jgi:hypothetical protein